MAPYVREEWDNFKSSPEWKIGGREGYLAFFARRKKELVEAPDPVSEA